MSMGYWLLIMGYELGVRIYGLGLELGVMGYWLWIWVRSYRLRARESSYIYVPSNRVYVHQLRCTSLWDIRIYECTLTKVYILL